MALSKVSHEDFTWKCCFAVFLATMCPFQYGVDFGLIAGIQAMIGFLKVSKSIDTRRLMTDTFRSSVSRTPPVLSDGTSPPNASSSSPP